MPQTPPNRLFQKLLLLIFVVAILRYGLSMIFPFLIGALLACAADPAVRFLCRKLSLRRGTAAFLGVTLTLIFLSTLSLLLFSALLQGLRWLATILPNLESAAQQGLSTLQDRLLSVSMKAPDGIRDLLTKAVLGIFNNGGSLYAQAVSALPGLAAGILSSLTGGFLGVGTGILSAYLISSRLPALKQWLLKKLPEHWHSQYRPVLLQIKQALLGWLKAQTRLAGMTFCILLAGFLLLRIPFAPVWALLIALMDAVPMLGTGLVLVPWSIVSFLQEKPFMAFGLLGIFFAATLLRSVLEPRMVGQQMGLDPLVTLCSLYLGYRLLGIPGLLTSPLLAVVVTQFYRTAPTEL